MRDEKLTLSAAASVKGRRSTLAIALVAVVIAGASIGCGPIPRIQEPPMSTEMPSNKLGLGAIDHIIYFANDLDRAVKFYTSTLGLPLKFSFAEQGVYGIQIGDRYLVLKRTEMKGGDVGRGPMMYLRVDDLKATLKKLSEKKVKVHVGPSEVPVGKIATIHDSEGNAIGLIQPSH